VPVFIGKSAEPEDLLLAVDGKGKGTYFETSLQTLSTKKQWIGFHSLSQGKVVVDAGAEKALVVGGRSLLPAGVVEVQGDFHPGDVIEVVNLTGFMIGRGVVNYASWQLRAAAGLSSEEVQRRVEVSRMEVIHRDEWITLAPQPVAIALESNNDHDQGGSNL
jgi:glutamate 5-kinase